MMDQSNDNAFLKRWIDALARLLDRFSGSAPGDNAALVDAMTADVPADNPLRDSKRRLLEEMCEDVDTFYDKMAEARRAPNLDRWFDAEVDSFARETIPDCTDEDVAQVRAAVERSMDDDIALQSDIINEVLGDRDQKADEK